MSSYAKLEAARRTIKSLADAGTMLEWDRDTIMPKGATEGRTAQLEALAVATHAYRTDPKLQDLLDEAKAEPNLNDWQQRNINLSQRDYDLSTALPEDLVARKSRAISQSHTAWLKARDRNDWRLWLPFFEEVVATSREVAQLRGEKAGISPYDACLDEYEQGNRLSDIQPMFNELEDFLVESLPTILDYQTHREQPTPWQTTFPVEKQIALCTEVMEALGYDRDHGRLDTTVHPFCGGATGDVRIATRYDEADFTPALFGLIHETGHALYEQGKPSAAKPFFLQPVGFELGMMIHESQSLLMEYQIGLSRPFLEWLAPLAAQTFSLTGSELTPARLTRQVQKVGPSLIRVEADEVTYPLHIILRTSIESQLVNGQMEARHVRDAWNEGMKQQLGVTVPEDKQGCLQDVHWPEGLIGYFPCYTQGAIAAAAFYRKARNDLPNLNSQLSAGDFKPLTTWLRENIHSQGSRYTAPELIKRVTGKPLELEPFKAHIKARYMPS